MSLVVWYIITLHTANYTRCKISDNKNTITGNKLTSECWACYVAGIDLRYTTLPGSTCVEVTRAQGRVSLAGKARRDSHLHYKRHRTVNGNRV